MALLTVLSQGGGQESYDILLHLLHTRGFRRQYAPETFVMVMADTGDEHDYTYEHVRYLQQLCARWDLEFHFLAAGSPYHSAAWPSLLGQQRRTNTVGCKAYPKSCTEQLKIRVIYRWLSEWVADRYGLPRSGDPYKGKTPLVEFAERWGKIDMLIGITAEEAVRRLGGEMPGVWAQIAINRRYPLVELGYTRALCQRHIRSLNYPLPPPSYCKRCPYTSAAELLLLYRTDRPAFEEWVEVEAAKLAANLHMGDKNFGVWGRLDLRAALAKAEEQYGSWTLEELREYQMSHGHCVASKY